MNDKYKKTLALVLLSIGLITILPTCAQEKNEDASIYHAPVSANLDDTSLLNLVQQQTLRYFWEFAHPVSGLARERSNKAYQYGLETTTIGGTGFGIMAIVVGVDRKWIGRDTATRHLLKMINFSLL